MLFEWAGFGVRHLGIVLHDLLRRVADEGMQHWNAARARASEPLVRRALASRGLSDDELDESVAAVVEALSAVLEDQRGRWILSAEHRQAENELALSGVLDGKLVSVYIDRTFVDAEGVRWIVDYKSGRHEGADAQAFLDQEQARYAPQLERYARLMSIHDPRPVRVGLYFPLLRGWRAWAPTLEENVR